MGFIVFLVIVAAAVAAYVYRVQLLAKISGQSQDRVARALERRKKK